MRNDRVYPCPSPLGELLKDIFCEIERLLQPDAAVTEHPDILRKVLTIRRIMKIDVILVRDQKFHLPHDVLRPSLLAEEEVDFLRSHLRPVDRPGINPNKRVSRSSPETHIV